MQPNIRKFLYFFVFYYSTATMASSNQNKGHFHMYKNKALGLDELRKRREEEGVQLRKQKREEQVCQEYSQKLNPLSVFSTDFFFRRAA